MTYATIGDTYTVSAGMVDTTNMSSSSIIYQPIQTNTSYTGSVLTTSGSTTAWQDTNATLDVRGSANFEGDITIKGVKLSETLSRIEDRLAILRPNPQLEEKWSKLAELRKAYQEMEADIIEKEKIINILKK